MRVFCYMRQANPLCSTIYWGHLQFDGIIFAHRKTSQRINHLRMAIGYTYVTGLVSACEPILVADKPFKFLALQASTRHCRRKVAHRDEAIKVAIITMWALMVTVGDELWPNRCENWSGFFVNGALDRVKMHRHQATANKHRACSLVVLNEKLGSHLQWAGWTFEHIPHPDELCWRSRFIFICIPLSPVEHFLHLGIPSSTLIHENCSEHLHQRTNIFSTESVICSWHFVDCLAFRCRRVSMWKLNYSFGLRGASHITKLMRMGLKEINGMHLTRAFAKSTQTDTPNAFRRIYFSH